MALSLMVLDSVPTGFKNFEGHYDLVIGILQGHLIIYIVSKGQQSKLTTQRNQVLTFVHKPNVKNKHSQIYSISHLSFDT